MRKEFEQIDKILRENGWISSNQPEYSELSEYIKSYDKGDNVVGIEVALDRDALGAYGFYGICGVNLTRFRSPMPYGKDDIKEMGRIIGRAEEELLKIEVPFRPTYAFSSAIEHHLGVNLDLRDKYNLQHYEDEDWG